MEPVAEPHKDAHRSDKMRESPTSRSEHPPRPYCAAQWPRAHRLLVQVHTYAHTYEPPYTHKHTPADHLRPVGICEQIGMGRALCRGPCADVDGVEEARWRPPPDISMTSNTHVAHNKRKGCRPWVCCWIGPSSWRSPGGAEPHWQSRKRPHAGRRLTRRTGRRRAFEFADDLPTCLAATVTHRPGTGLRPRG